MTTLTLAHGRASHAVVRWLHARPVRGVSLQRPINHDADPAAHDREGREEAIRLALAAGAGEMLHLGAPSTYLQHNTPGVAEALGLARKLPGRDPVDVMDEQLDHLCATLCSPKVRAAVLALAGALLRAPGGEMGGDDARRVIEKAVRSPLRRGHEQPMHPRTIHVEPARD
jgi:hypothetical protein